MEIINGKRVDAVTAHNAQNGRNLRSVAESPPESAGNKFDTAFTR
jgi:hypothetical protein